MKKYLFIALALLLAACEKPVLDEDIASTREANVILHMTQYEQESFGTRAATNITELCSRLNVAIFDAEGTKVKTVAQKEADAGYGTVALTLAAGTYQLVVIAHNGEGSATISSTEKVTFPNNKVTDTFYYYGDLVVTSEVQSYDLTLTRAVAMFRLVLTDEEIPSTVTKFKFLLHWRFFDFQSLGWLRLRKFEADRNPRCDRRRDHLRHLHLAAHRGRCADETHCHRPRCQRQHREGAHFRERPRHSQPDYPLHRQFFR